MAETREDDLFRESTMTFGQHLEELRGCLVKSALGLAAGFAMGLMVGGYVVQFIQQPLTHALTTYYEKESEHKVKAELEKMQQSGRAAPWTPEEITDRVEREHLLADEVYVDTNELLQRTQEGLSRSSSKTCPCGSGRQSRPAATRPPRGSSACFSGTTARTTPGYGARA